jgi:hypothetical protein
MKRLLALALVVAAFGGTAGCRGMKDPASVADNFVDKYYVESDQDRALQFTTGIATMRLKDELKLTAEARGGRGTAGMQVRPERVYYKRGKVAGSGQKRSADYDLDIRPQGGGDLQRSAHVDLVQEQDGSWRVSNFSETQR